jgi:hypothetical protein
MLGAIEPLIQERNLFHAALRGIRRIAGVFMALQPPDANGLKRRDQWSRVYGLAEDALCGDGMAVHTATRPGGSSAKQAR